MKLLLGFFLVCTAMSVLVVAALVQLLIHLLPYLILIAAVVLVVRMLRGRHAAPPVAGLPARRPHTRRYHRPPLGAAPSPPTGWAPGAAPGWVLLPVWVGPPARPSSPVIDAEVIEEDGRA